MSKRKSMKHRRGIRRISFTQNKSGSKLVQFLLARGHTVQRPLRNNQVHDGQFTCRLGALPCRECGLWRGDFAGVARKAA